MTRGSSIYDVHTKEVGGGSMPLWTGEGVRPVKMGGGESVKKSDLCGHNKCMTPNPVTMNAVLTGSIRWPTVNTNSAVMWIVESCVAASDANAVK